MNRTCLNTFFGITMLAASVITASPVQASDESAADAPYEFVVVGERSFGGLIAAGEAHTAIDRLKGRPKDDRFSFSTNLCVAHAIVGEFEKAGSYCDQAVQTADRASRPKARTHKGRLGASLNLAIAHSNRGVLRALSGDHSGASEDFRRAMAQDGDLRAPVANFAQLDGAPAVPVALRVTR